MFDENESELVALCLRGDKKAMRRLYDVYAPGLLALSVRYVKDLATAEDVLQESFVRILTRLDQYEGTGSLRAWMNRIVVNESLFQLRAVDKWNDSVDLEEFQHEDFGQEYDASDLGADDILECIKELPERYRAVFNLYAIEGYTHREIAKMLGVKEVTSRSLFLRSREMLQEKVAFLTRKK